MEEFNKKSVRADSYEEELNAYVRDKAFNMCNILEYCRNFLEKEGLFIEQLKSCIRNYSPLTQLLAIAKASCTDSSVTKRLEDAFKNITSSPESETSD